MRLQVILKMLVAKLDKGHLCAMWMIQKHYRRIT